MATAPAQSRSVHIGRRRRRWGRLQAQAFLLVVLVAGAGLAALPKDGLSWLLGEPTVTAASVAAMSFSACTGSTRTTCVVDGDTFWLDGDKFRIADINTPEVGQPQCAAEAALGQQATMRLQELLSAGPFELRPIDRDEDVYGRKLRIVERDGQSIGQVLVAEGLAHSWQGRRESWC